MIRHDEFLQLNFDELHHFLSREDLNVETEVSVFKAVMRWVNADLTARESRLPALLREIRLTTLPMRYFTDIVDKDVRSCA